MEIGQVATSYIPTSRATYVVVTDVAMSVFMMFGVWDFGGPIGAERINQSSRSA